VCVAAQLTLLEKRGASAAILAATALLISKACGLDMRGLVATGGLVGLSFSLAVREVLANYVAGMSLVIWRPFLEGDEVIVEAKGLGRIQAKIEDMGPVHTTMRDLDQQIVYVPNAQLISQSVTNTTRATHTRLLANITLRFEDLPRLEALIAALSANLRKQSQLDEKAGPTVVAIVGYDALGINLRVQAVFRKYPLKSPFIKSAGWLIIGQTVADTGCAFAVKPYAMP